MKNLFTVKYVKLIQTYLPFNKLCTSHSNQMQALYLISHTVACGLNNWSTTYAGPVQVPFLTGITLP